MLKEVTWPTPLEVKAGEVTRTAPQILLEVVMNQAFWRESFERIEAADAICEVLEAGGPTARFTPSQRETLIAGMKLEGHQVTPPIVNRYYIRIMRAVHQAADVKE